MFDIAAEIKTEKRFEDLTVKELVEATLQRLGRVLADGDLDAFGFCDESEEEPCKPKAQSAYYTLGIVNGYDALEVHTVATFFDDYAEQIQDGEDLPEEGPVCWSLYGHICNEGLERIGDFVSFEEACEVAEKLGGVKFTQEKS
jgi:hypothetical protein